MRRSAWIGVAHAVFDIKCRTKPTAGSDAPLVSVSVSTCVSIARGQEMIFVLFVILAPAVREA